MIKGKGYIPNWFSFFVALTLVSTSGGKAQAPQLGTLPDGSALKGSFGGETAYLRYNDNAIWTKDPKPRFKNWTPPNGTTIVLVANKEGKNPFRTTYAILLSDGSIYFMFYSASPGDEYWINPYELGKISTPTDTDAFKDFLYDDMYALRFYVWVSRDDGVTWQIDSAGLGGSTVVKDLALDTTGNVYAATSGNGLYFQGRTVSVWQKNATLVPTFLNSVFVDRQNRIYVSSTAVHYSTDNGTSWNQHSTGMGNRAVSKFGDDSFGNVYAITDNGNRLWRSSGGNQAWTQIDGPIRSLAVDTTASLFNDISGDSTLSAATAFGLFTSTNQGTSWTQVIEGFESDGLNGFLKLSSGRLIAGTDLGVYYLDPASTSWTKAFPTSGFLRIGGFQQDNLGNLFTLAGGVIYKSTDNGSTWAQDNTGLVTIDRRGIFYIDETGVQHYLVNWFVLNQILYVRSGSSWSTDISGIATTGNDMGLAIQSDHKGNLFVSINIIGGARMWRRSISGGSWTADTVGIGTKPLSALVRYLNGDMIGSSFQGGMFRRKSVGWAPVTLPPSQAGREAYLLSVDSSGSLYAAFRGFSLGVRFWSGVYVSADTGLTWQYAGLDSVELTGLISYGDTTYALTGQGVFLLSTNISAPVLVSPADGATGISTDTTLTWSATLGATSYQVQVSGNAAFTTTIMSDSGISATSRAVNGLTASTTYYWRVRASGPGGTSAWSSVWSFTTLGSAPAVPTLVSPASGATDQPLNVILRWRVSATAATYRVQVATDSGFASPVIDDSTLADTLKQMSGLSVNTKYYWRVNAKNAGGTSAFSAIENFTTGTPTAVYDLEGIPTEFSLLQNYPNPFNPSTVIRYGLPTRSQVKLEIYNVLGQRVALLADEEQDARFYEKQWQAPVSSGLYFYRLQAVSTEDPNKRFVQVRKMLLLK